MSGACGSVRGANDAGIDGRRITAATPHGFNPCSVTKSDGNGCADCIAVRAYPNQFQDERSCWLRGGGT